MARKLSRRSLALHVATHLVNGKPQKEIALQLAAYLMSTRRTKELGSIIRDVQYYLADRGHIAGTVFSAQELSAVTLKELESFTRGKTGAQNVTFDTEVDESLIGGVRIQIPGYELDTTISRQLTILKTRYKKA